MENAEEILQCLDEFSKLKPKDIPRELEEYLCFVAKTGDPVYQWPLIKCLFREKLVSVITEFYEACPSVEIPPCPNVDAFNYDAMKSFILEKLDTFAAAPFTVQRICELLTSPRKEYNRIDKYMRALEKNILVVSTREPGNRKSTENGESIVNGLESEHVSQEIINSDINVEVEMDETATWPKSTEVPLTVAYAVSDTSVVMDTQPAPVTNVVTDSVQDTYVSESSSKPLATVAVTTTDTAASVASTTEAETAATCSSSIETVITSRPIGYIVPDASSMFAMTTEPILPVAEQLSTSKDEPTTFVAVPEQQEAAFVKADCSETPYSSDIHLEPEPSAVQMDQPPGKPSESVTDEPMVREPTPSDAVIEAEPSQTSSSDSHIATEPDVVDSSVEINEPQQSSTVLDTPSSSAAAAVVVSSAPAEPAEHSPTPSSEKHSNETVISSSDEQDIAPGSSEAAPTVPDSAEPAASSCTAENQVSESNQAEYVVSQTDTSPVQATPAHPSEPVAETSSAVTQTPAESTGDESMEVDEPTQVTESSSTTSQHTDTTTTADDVN
ncbi:Protein phosphatase 4 regulatory subunit 2-related protein [Carabus blaptoides fortunei]